MSAAVFEPIRGRELLLLRLAFLGILSFAAVQQRARLPISCERHTGDFSGDFSGDFDIDSLDCRVSAIKNAPTFRFWGVYPYVGIVPNG